MTSYIGKFIRYVYGEDKLAKRDEEITRLTQLLSQREAELARKDIELDQKNAELLQVLSQAQRRLAQNAIMLNDVKQELLSAKQKLAQRDAELAQRDAELAQRDTELAQRNAELAQERICIRDRTLPAPIDIQVKLGEMFKSWPGLTSFDTPLHLKIRAATEQIKEPIMGLFHVTYNIDSNISYMNAYALLFTATDVYYLSNHVHKDPTTGIMYNQQMVTIEYRSNTYMNPMSNCYTFVDPVWVKLGAISKNANFKKIIQWNNQYSGYTGKDYSNPNGGNSVYVDSGSKTAMHRRTLLQSEYDRQWHFGYDR